MKLRNLLLIGTVLGVSAWWFKRQRERANEMPLANKVVIITGASAGIGRATAHAFAQAGAHVVLVARRANVLADVQDELQQYGVRTMTIPADMSRDDDINMVGREVQAMFGRVDVLINNAGLVMGGHLEEYNESTLKQLVDVNIYGAIRMTQAILPLMKAQHHGHIVNVSSVAAGLSAPGLTVYSASKAGLNQFSVGLSRELKHTGVRVSVVMPGWTDTGMIEHLPRDKMPGIGEGFNLIHTVEEVAEAIVDAVRFNRRYVVMGGVGMQIGVSLDSLNHRLGDIIYTVYGEDDITELNSYYGQGH